MAIAPVPADTVVVRHSTIGLAGSWYMAVAELHHMSVKIIRDGAMVVI